MVYSEQRVHGFAGNNSGCSVTLGGVTPEGACAVNELSYLFLDAEETVCMGSDDLVIRIADDTPDDFLLAACRVARHVGGKLEFPGGPHHRVQPGAGPRRPGDRPGFMPSPARTSPVVGGRVYNVPGGIISLPGILELALNDGVHRMTGLHLGAHTGDCTQFTTFDQLWDAFCAQVRHVIPHCHAIKNADKAAFSAVAPSPFQSALCPVCVEAGTDLIDGGTAPDYFFAMSLAGGPNVGDSLAALKKFVFEEKRVSMARVKAALETNFERDPALRALAAVRPQIRQRRSLCGPAGGPGAELCQRHRGRHPRLPRGSFYGGRGGSHRQRGAGHGAGGHPRRPAGRASPSPRGGSPPPRGATPRASPAPCARWPGWTTPSFATGRCSTCASTPRRWKARTSCTSLPTSSAPMWTRGDFWSSSTSSAPTPSGTPSSTPERHRDLVVRVATYAAYFIELGPELQEDIIHRLEISSL